MSKIAQEPIYQEGTQAISIKIQGYDQKTDEEQHAFWSWFHDYVDNHIHWGRKHVYVLYYEFIIPTGMEQLIEDYGEYHSGITGDCGNPISLKSDPKDIDIFDYSRSYDWLFD